MAELTRAEHLAWAKARALEYVDAGDPAQAVTSLLSDLCKWEGGALYAPELLCLLAADGMLFASRSVAATRHWIEGIT